LNIISHPKMTTRLNQGVWGDSDVDRSFRRMRQAMNNMMRDFENDAGFGDFDRRWNVPLLGQGTQNQLSQQPQQQQQNQQQFNKANQLTPFGGGRELELFGGGGLGQLSWPAIDITENGKNYLLTADVPGLQKGDVDITIQGNNLVLKGEHKEEKKDEQQNYYYRERRYGKFERSIPLPMNVDAKGITAMHDRGQLTITLPKNLEAQQKINVQ